MPPELRLVEQLLVPNRFETDLVRACLWMGPKGVQAFEAWSADAETALDALRASRGGKRRLLPLLQAAIEREGTVPPAAFHAPLHAATMYEQLRTQAYGEIAGTVLRALAEAQVPFLATRGVVFSRTLYGSGTLRHCHDIDLLAPAALLPAIAAVLCERCGFHREDGRGVHEGDMLLLHDSGLPLVLHHAQAAAAAVPWDDLYARRTLLELYTAPCPAPSATHALLQVLMQGPFAAQRDSLLWVCDAYHLLTQCAIEWETVMRSVGSDAARLSLGIVLDYLARALDAPVPRDVLAEVRERMRGSNAGEVVILRLLQAGVVSRRQVWTAASATGTRAAAMRTLLFPAAGALRQVGLIRSYRDAPRYWCGQIAGIASHLLRLTGRPT